MALLDSSIAISEVASYIRETTSYKQGFSDTSNYVPEVQAGFSVAQGNWYIRNIAPELTKSNSENYYYCSVANSFSNTIEHTSYMSALSTSLVASNNFYFRLPVEGFAFTQGSVSIVSNWIYGMSVPYGTTVRYYLRGWDTVANNFVYWSSVSTPNITPSATNPLLTGTLTNVCIVGSI